VSVPDPAITKWVPLAGAQGPQGPAGAAPTVAYGTTLPASPVDGQIAALTDSVSSPTFTWLFRYNASSSSAYKWEFIGGAPRHVEWASNHYGAWGSYTDGGLYLYIPRAGDYDITISGEASGSDSYALFSYQIDGVTGANDVWCAGQPLGGGGTGQSGFSARRRWLGLPAGQVIRWMIRGNTAYYQWPRMHLLPVRVA
jgi:hypothetical protein